jgi:hypothetical protein
MQNTSLNVEQREPFERMEWRLTSPVRVVIRNVASLARDLVKAIFSALDHCGSMEAVKNDKTHMRGTAMSATLREGVCSGTRTANMCRVKPSMLRPVRKSAKCREKGSSRIRIQCREFSTEVISEAIEGKGQV